MLGCTIIKITISIRSKITRFSAQAETPQAEPGQKSAYKENNDKVINNGKLNRIHRKIIGIFAAEWNSVFFILLAEYSFKQSQNSKKVIFSRTKRRE